MAKTNNNLGALEPEVGGRPGKSIRGMGEQNVG